MVKRVKELLDGLEKQESFSNHLPYWLQQPQGEHSALKHCPSASRKPSCSATAVASNSWHGMRSYQAKRESSKSIRHIDRLATTENRWSYCESGSQKWARWRATSWTACWPSSAAASTRPSVFWLCRVPITATTCSPRWSEPCVITLIHCRLERILNQQATPKASWQALSDRQQETLRGLTEADSIDARRVPSISISYSRRMIPMTRSRKSETNLRQQILQHLETLSILVTSEQIDQILAEASKSQLSDLQLLERFLAVPAHRRLERSIERRLRMAKFRDARLWNPSTGPSIKRRLIRCRCRSWRPVTSFAARTISSSWVSPAWEKAISFKVWGAVLALGYRVRYTTSAELLEDLMAASGDKTLPRRVCYYKRFDLLIIDESGFDKLERREYPESSGLLYKVIDSRSGRGSRRWSPMLTSSTGPSISAIPRWPWPFWTACWTERSSISSRANRIASTELSSGKSVPTTATVRPAVRNVTRQAIRRHEPA